MSFPRPVVNHIDSLSISASLPDLPGPQMGGASSSRPNAPGWRAREACGECRLAHQRREVSRNNSRESAPEPSCLLSQVEAGSLRIRNIWPIRTCGELPPLVSVRPNGSSLQLVRRLSPTTLLTALGSRSPRTGLAIGRSGWQMPTAQFPPAHVLRRSAGSFPAMVPERPTPRVRSR